MKFILLAGLISVGADLFAQEEPIPVIPEPVEEIIYDFIEVAPSFPGGESAMMKFIQENVKYPEDAKNLGIQGIVYVQFVVDTNGVCSDTKVLREVSESIDAEAIRIISIMPNWLPAQQNGKKVKVRYTLPIRFRLH